MCHEASGSGSDIVDLSCMVIENVFFHVDRIFPGVSYPCPYPCPCPDDCIHPFRDTLLGTVSAEAGNHHVSGEEAHP